MTFRSTLSLAFVLLAAGGVRADELTSGPQVGGGITGGFRVSCATGQYVGKNCCPV